VKVMAVPLLVAEVIIGALYVVASLLTNNEFLYGFGCGIFGAALAVLLTLKTGT
jgi:uncharacterized membrane protein